MKEVLLGMLLMWIINNIGTLLGCSMINSRRDTINKFFHEDLKKITIKRFSGLKGKDWWLKLLLFNLIPGTILYWLFRKQRK